MDDLVLAGSLGIIGLCIVAIMVLYGVFSLAGLIFSSYASGEYGIVLVCIVAILMAGSLYMAVGWWLHATDRI